MQLKITDKKLKMVEEMGVLFEQGGMQPAAARVLALLMIADKIELTFEEIYETLHISKSAASNAINFLISTSRVEYITRPGERKRYFRNKINSMKEIIQKSVTGFDAMNVMLKKILAERPADTKEFNANIREIILFMDFMKAELPALFEKWEARKR